MEVRIVGVIYVCLLNMEEPLCAIMQYVWTLYTSGGDTKRPTSSFITGYDRRCARSTRATYL